MPETLADVSELVTICREHDVGRITLLVVPGRDWSGRQLDVLRSWSEQGFQLAGHGWMHRCQSIRGFKHRLHSWLLSRDVAEHLSLTAGGSVQLIQRCADWFDDVGLGHCGLYVPPAWALQRLSLQQLRQVPFRLVETLSGVVWTQSGLRRSLPLVGFEADTGLRKGVVGIFNQCNRLYSQQRARPLRISIHPQDHRLRLARQLHRFLALPMEPIYYDQLVTA